MECFVAVVHQNSNTWQIDALAMGDHLILESCSSRS